jgi:hypothetical protein
LLGDAGLGAGVGEVRYESLHVRAFWVSSLPIGGGEKIKSFLLFPLEKILLSLV